MGFGDEIKKKKKNKSSMTIKHKNINNPDFVNVYDNAAAGGGGGGITLT